MTSAPMIAPLPYRWVMLGLVWLAYASLGLVSSSVAPLVTPIAEELAISYAQMGTILGAWQLAYIGFAYAAGTVIDRVGLRRALGFGIVVMAASALLRGLAGGYWTMFAAVALFGIGGPMISIGAPKLIATWFQGHERGTAAGVYSTGPAIGGILVLSTANSVLLPATASWRWTIAFYGLLVVVVAAIWWTMARSDADVPSASQGAGADALRLLRIRNVTLVLIIGFASFLAGHSLNNWLPKILTARGFDPVSAGFWASVPNAVGIVGSLLLPRLVCPHQRTRAVAAMFGVSAVALALIGTVDGLPLLAALMVQGMVRSISPFLMLVMMETPAVGAAAMGAAGGLYFTIGEIGGFSGPTLMGLIFDLTGSFAIGLLSLAGLMAVMGLTCFALERPTAPPASSPRPAG